MMINCSKLLARFFLLVFWVSTQQLSGLAQEVYEWASIIPGNTSRLEVESSFGKAEISYENYGFYETAQGKYSIWYSTGTCYESDALVYKKIDKDVVIMIIFQSRTTLFLLDLKDLLLNAQKEPSISREGGFTYIASDGSTRIETVRLNNQEVVLEIERTAGVSVPDCNCQQPEKRLTQPKKRDNVDE